MMGYVKTPLSKEFLAEKVELLEHKADLKRATQTTEEACLNY